MGTTEASRQFQRQQSSGEPTVVDHVSLEVMGFIFGGVTAIVIAIGALVVTYHVDGRVALDQTRAAVQISTPTRAIIPVSLIPRR